VIIEVPIMTRKEKHIGSSNSQEIDKKSSKEWKNNVWESVHTEYHIIFQVRESKLVDNGIHHGLIEIGTEIVTEAGEADQY